MHATRSFTFSCLASVMLLGLGGQAFGNNLAVGLCPAPGTHYTAINAAVTAAAAAGDTIRVCPGTYPEQVTITKSLTLIGIASGASDAAVRRSPATRPLPH